MKSEDISLVKYFSLQFYNTHSTLKLASRILLYKKKNRYAVLFGVPSLFTPFISSHPLNEITIRNPSITNTLEGKIILLYTIEYISKKF